MKLAILFTLILFRCAFAQYHIIGTQDVNSYTTIAEKNTLTLTSCILTCKNNANCTLAAHNDEGGQCFLLKDKVQNDQTKKYTPKLMTVVRLIEENTTMESDVEWVKAPINGGWSCWNTTLPCNTSCGGGYRLKNRTCSHPPPSNGGDLCILTNAKVRGLKEGIYEKCNINPCPIDGGFGGWTSSVTCSATCGIGAQEWTRSCNNPRPEYGGKDCVGDVKETRFCNLRACPAVDGGFGQWAPTGKCSVCCGGGSQKWTRVCDSPTPEYGGKDCIGHTTEVRSCNVNPCPGYNIITSGSCASVSEDDCKKYAASYCKAFVSFDGSNFPPGCFVWQGKVYFNNNNRSTKPCSWSECVCKKD